MINGLINVKIRS